MYLSWKLEFSNNSSFEQRKGSKETGESLESTPVSSLLSMVKIDLSFHLNTSLSLDQQCFNGISIIPPFCLKPVRRHASDTVNSHRYAFGKWLFYVLYIGVFSYISAASLTTITRSFGCY